MRMCLFCFSDSGADLALKLCREMDIRTDQVHSIPKYALKYGFTSHESVCADMGGLFAENDALVFIGACGIAVRDIAPHLKGKTVDPAVLVMDDQGRFVIPILSGHIGGANDLARKIARKTGAVPVITTATDGAGKFSCDAWAQSHDCVLSSMDLAKEVSARILVGDVPVSSEYDLPCLPQGLAMGGTGDLGIFIGIHVRSPYSSTLRLVPRIVTIGIGCRKGVSFDAVRRAVDGVFERNGIDIRSVCKIATIDVKKDEKALLDLARGMDVPLLSFSAQELNGVCGDFSDSEFVRNTVGTGNVCERAAVLAGGRLMVGKNAENGVTVAVSVREWGIEF